MNEPTKPNLIANPIQNLRVGLSGYIPPNLSALHFSQALHNLNPPNPFHTVPTHKSIGNLLCRIHCCSRDAILQDGKCCVSRCSSNPIRLHPFPHKFCTAFRTLQFGQTQIPYRENSSRQVELLCTLWFCHRETRPFGGSCLHNCSSRHL